MTRATHYDVIIVGAGPGGSAAAAAFAREGARVLVLEAGGAASRLAGEWLHPAGVATLEALDLMPEGLPSAWGEGFVVFPEDDSDPIRLRYPSGLAFSAEHALFVRALRGRLRAYEGVTLLEGARVRALDPSRVVYVHEGREESACAERIVGADGRGSLARKALGLGRDETPARGRMAGVLLRELTLPFEGFGHVFVGGPGPALLYRIDDAQARLCLDVPEGSVRDARGLYEAFAKALPLAVRRSLRDALELEPPRWAAVRVRARRCFGAGAIALLGDATGSVHPLCAAGMTLALRDARVLAGAPDVEGYARARLAEGRVPELLSDALHTVLVGRDRATTSVRRAMYGLWRADEGSRARTMALLSGESPSSSEFARTFSAVALDAARSLAKDALAEGSLSRGAQDLRALGRFARYPLEAFSGPGARLRVDRRPLEAPRTRDIDALPLRLAPSAPTLDGEGLPKGEEFAFCVEALAQVSRSFAKPIGVLPGTLRAAVTVGYLLCRVADTIEDAPALDEALRDACFARFLDAVEGRASCGRFARGLSGLSGSPEELALARRLDAVLAVRDALPEREASIVTRWVVEMTRGMAIYTRRPRGRDGFFAPATTSDLERYCYFVAGTVGHMLTELFVAHLGADEVKEAELRASAESFGIGLQLVNILKDLADDAQRGASFVPRALVVREGLSHEGLLDPAQRARAHEVVAPLFELARAHLDRALDYVLAIPAEALRVRLFCAIPLFMAARTLVHARGGDAMFERGAPVKIERAEVESLAAECLERGGDDAWLRRRYATLWAARPSRSASGDARLGAP